MALGSFSKALSVASMTVERVPVYRLLGVTVNSALKWDDHVAAINSKSENVFGSSRNLSVPVFQSTTLYVLLSSCHSTTVGIRVA